MWRASALVGMLVLFPAVASAQQPCTTSDARHVVNLIYSHVLERAADRGSNTHVEQLRRGDVTVRDVVAAIVKSSEHDRRFMARGDRQASVRNLYRHILGREADRSGLEAHSEALGTQGAEVVIDSILDSAEYQEKYGTNGVPGSPGMRYCPDERPLGTTGSSDLRFRDTFTSLDTNRDGLLTADEWAWSSRSFYRQDGNGDGVITRREFSGGPVDTTGRER